MDAVLELLLVGRRQIQELESGARGVAGSDDGQSLQGSFQDLQRHADRLSHANAPLRLEVALERDNSSTLFANSFWCLLGLGAVG